MLAELNLDSRDVAAYIVKYCAYKNYFINLTKLQKILYCCYGAVLADSDARLTKEHPKAWDHGPVFPRVYNLKTKNPDGFIQGLIEREEHIKDILSSRVMIAINATIDLFSKYTAGALVEWTHRPVSPWYKCTDGGKNLYGEIPDELIREYFLTFINKQDK